MVSDVDDHWDPAYGDHRLLLVSICTSLERVANLCDTISSALLFSSGNQRMTTYPSAALNLSFVSSENAIVIDYNGG